MGVVPVLANQIYPFGSHDIFNKSSACTSETSLPCLQITCFRENNGCGNANGFGIEEEVILNFLK